MTNNLDATVFVFRHKNGSIVATYLDQAKAHEQNPKFEHVATIEPRTWIQAHYDEIGRIENTTAQTIERRNLELHVKIREQQAEITRLTAERDRALDRIAAMAAENEQMRAALKMWIDRHKNDESQEHLMISYAYALGATEKALQSKGVSQ